MISINSNEGQDPDPSVEFREEQCINELINKSKAYFNVK